MRIYFSSTNLPKKAAKRIYARFGEPDKSSPTPFSLSAAKEIAACLLGYESWHSLHTITKSQQHTPSKFDEDCSENEQLLRLEYQCDRLDRFSPLIKSERKLLALEFRVSAKNPRSKSLLQQLHFRNTIINDDALHGAQGWRYQPSIESQLNKSLTHDLCEAWEFKNISFAKHVQALDAALTDRPEDTYVIEEFLRLSLETGRIEPVRHRLNGFERVLLDALPDDFPTTGKVQFEWGARVNRVWIRCCYWLAASFYEDGDYRKARKWFNFVIRISDRFEQPCRTYLKDLELAQPTGAVSVWE
jgi:hypothetical protein